MTIPLMAASAPEAAPIPGNRVSLWQHARALGPVLLIALLLRLALLLPQGAAGIVSFHSDEAVVGLMARHILQGEFPVFFYGQAYMGSLDAFLVAGAFVLFGESVASIRIAQTALYLLVVASAYFAAWQLSGRILVAVITALLFAVPNVLLATYSTATLGGYNETLLLGNCIVLLGFGIARAPTAPAWRWALLGVCTGVGWWTNGLIIMYALPVAIFILARSLLKRPTRAAGQHAGAGWIPVRGILAALAGFLLGSTPWWIFALQNEWSPLLFYIGSEQLTAFAGTEVFQLSFGERLIGLFLLGLPALFGMRFPWAADYWLPGLSSVIVLLHLISFVVLIGLVRRDHPSEPGRAALRPGAAALLLLMLGLFCLIFVASRFSGDPTGRYFLPLLLPVYVALAALIAAFRWRLVRVALVALPLVHALLGQAVAVSQPVGLTTQFNLITHLSNEHDDDLIAFLDAQRLHHGFTHYWIAFRLAFLSQERLQYSASLPYKQDLTYTLLDERYPPYRETTLAAVEAGEPVAFITANVPELDAQVVAELEAAAVRYRTRQIGPFTVYYDLEPAVCLPIPPFAP